MSTVTGSMYSRLSVFAGLLGVTTLSLLSLPAHAQFQSNYPDPFYGNGEEVLQEQSPLYTPGIGYSQTFTISGFNEFSGGGMPGTATPNNNIIGGNDVIDYTANFGVTFYSDSAQTMPILTLSLPGQFDVTLFGRTSDTELGTFLYTVDMATFSGMVGGNTVQTQLNPADVTEGTVTITRNMAPMTGYTINAPALVYAQQVINGTTYDVPVLTATTQVAGSPLPPNPVPEPSTLTMAGAMVAGACFAAMRRRRKA